MSRKSVFGVLAAAAAAAAALAAVKYVKDRKDSNDVDEVEPDDEVHFIEIHDDDEDEESDDDESEGPHLDEVGSEEAEEGSVDLHFAMPEEEGEDDVEIDEDVKEISSIYPYLKPAFIAETLSRSEEFNKEFPEDTLVSAMHTVIFEDLHDVLNFEVIMADAGYICQHDASMTVRAAKRFFAEEGAVISDILNVANQTAALHGKYVGCQLN